MTPDPITTAADFARLLEAQVRQQLGGARLTLTHYVTLVRANGLTVTDLAPQVGVTQQMVSKTVHDLKLLGYVKTVPSMRDRRRQLLQVTPGGREALAQASALHFPPALLAAMQQYVAHHQS